MISTKNDIKKRRTGFNNEWKTLYPWVEIAGSDGNICRSPTAEAVLQHLLSQAGKLSEWKVDSAAIADWNVGRTPDDRTIQTLKKNGIRDYKHIVRQVCDDDFREFEYIFGMDEANMSDLEELKPKNSKAKLKLLGEFDPQNELIIKDPYFDGDPSGFENVYEQCVRSCQGFLDFCEKKQRK